MRSINSIQHLWLYSMADLTLTRKEKAELLEALRGLKEKQLSLLRREAQKIAAKCEKTVSRRLNKVSVTIRSVKLLDVLETERDHTPSVQELGRNFRKERDGQYNSS